MIHKTSDELMKEFIEQKETEVFEYVRDYLNNHRTRAATFFNGKVWVDYGEFVGDADMSLVDMTNDYLESVERVGTGKMYIGDVDDAKLLRNNLMQCVEMLDKAIEEAE